MWAKTASGLVVILFAPAPFGFGGGSAPTRAAAGPTKVERNVSNGTIGWLDRREPRASRSPSCPAAAVRWCDGTRSTVA